MKTQKYKVIGLMSGTSLDGLDIAYCTFEKRNAQWLYKIEKAQTIPYPSNWKKVLGNAQTFSGEKLTQADVSYGSYLGAKTRDFINENRLRPDFITSHGHTVFHQPHNGFTLQIGNGNAIYAATEVPVVYDLRSLDVMRGGQGAPLVPIGDRLLFNDHDVCLNLGGIANLSLDVKKQRIAFDVCFVNMALNYLSEKTGKAFDRNGAHAASGDVNPKLLEAINRIYARLRNTRPSLGREIFENHLRPLIDNEKIALADRLRTVTESAAQEIVGTIRSLKKNAKVLCTGGGAFNAFLLARMLDLGGDEVTLIVPEDEIVKFKEALVFAFLGVLRVRDEANCLRSVTGASRDSSGGILVGF